MKNWFNCETCVKKRFGLCLFVKCCISAFCYFNSASEWVFSMNPFTHAFQSHSLLERGIVLYMIQFFVCVPIRTTRLTKYCKNTRFHSCPSWGQSVFFYWLYLKMTFFYVAFWFYSYLDPEKLAYTFDPRWFRKRCRDRFDDHGRLDWVLKELCRPERCWRKFFIETRKKPKMRDSYLVYTKARYKVVLILMKSWLWFPQPDFISSDDF